MNVLVVFGVVWLVGTGAACLFTWHVAYRVGRKDAWGEMVDYARATNRSVASAVRRQHYQQLARDSGGDTC